MADLSLSREDEHASLYSLLRNWLLGFGSVVLLIVGILYGVYRYNQPETVLETHPAVPVTVAETLHKGSAATINKATKPMDIPVAEVIGFRMLPSAVTTEPAENLSPAEQDFASRLINFERAIP